MFDLLVLKPLRLICRQSRVDMSISILNAITVQVYQKYSIATFIALQQFQYNWVLRYEIECSFVPESVN